MSKLVYEGNVKVYWLATAPANQAAPSAAEVGAGIDLTPYITKDGVSVPSTQNMVDVAGLNEVYNAEIVGSWGGGALTLTMFRDDTSETNAYDLIVYGTNGALVISRFGDGTTATDKVEVWPVEMHEPTLMQTAKDEVQKFTASFAVTAAPSVRAVVAA